MDGLAGLVKSLVTKHRRVVVLLGGIVAALVMYALGVKFVLPLLLVVLSALYLPAPKLLNSWVGRVLVAIIINIVLLQAAAIIQFLLLPQSDFVAVAALYSLLAAGIIAYFYNHNEFDPPKTIASRRDAFAGVTVLIFALPLVVTLAGNLVPGIVNYGGLQSPDAGHHYDFVNVMAHQQHLDTSGYPKSFHLGMAFMQDSVGLNQQTLSWSANVVLFFTQLLVLGAILTACMHYLCSQILQRLGYEAKGVAVNLALSVALGVTASLLVLWPFLTQGFLNYYFVGITIILASLYLADYVQAGHSSLADVSLLFGAGLLFGTVAAWPLLLPAIVLWLGILVWPKGYGLVQMIKYLFTTKVLPLLVIGLFMLAPVVLQLLYPGGTELNDLGALRTPHLLPLIAGVALLAIVILRKDDPGLKLSVFAMLTPLFVLTLTVIFMQLFVVGEIRYFSIKLSLLLEALLLVVGVAYFAASISRSKLGAWQRVLVLATAPLLGLVLLLSNVDNPLKDTRDLFRDYSGQGKPAFYDQDARNFADLGAQDKINNFNATVLHYDQQSGKFVAHTLLAQWAQTIKFDRDPTTLKTKSCHRLIYHIVVYGMGTQQDLAAKVKECAASANSAGRDYYIITDNASIPKLREVLGDSVKYVGS